MEYRVGDSVRVRPGVKCPDRPELDMGGWQGRVTEMHEEEGTGKPLLDIAWDSDTLRAMPRDFIEASERSGLEWSAITLYPEEVEPAPPRDAQDDVDAALDELEGRYQWLGMGEEGERIYAVVSSAAGASDLDALKAWEGHLRRTLALPMTAMGAPFAEGSSIAGEMVTVLGIEFADDDYGVVASCTLKGAKRLCPLADLEPLDEGAPNAQALNDYQTWFANS